MLIDTHCHINSKELRLEARSVISRAWEADVRKMLIVGTDYEDSCEAVALTEDFSQFDLYASVGIHPHEAKRYETIPEEFSILLKNRHVVAVGEIGLDYHYDISPRDVQQKMFEEQLEFAELHNKPVVMHVREAMPDALEILKRHRGLKMLFHCYGGGLHYLDEVLALNGMCGFGGAITWNNKVAEEYQDVLRVIPIENILIETDSPYLSPIPFRGKVNEPAYIKYIYDTAAQERHMSLSEFAGQVEANAKKFFEWE